MQAIKDVATSAAQSGGGAQRLRYKRVVDALTSENRRLVEVPYTATLAHTMNALVANRVVAVPVAAPPGHWIGAGGSMILEADKQTGAVRKHYIGMVTMLDILAHIAGDCMDTTREDPSVLEQRMAVPVSSVIGHCLESLSLWTLNPNTSVADCMEVFSKGIHRALVPLDSNMENIAGVELVESASSYRMFTQMDLLRFLKAHEPELTGVMSRTVLEIGGVSDTVFGITHRAKVIEAIKSMKTASLNAVPVVEALTGIEEDPRQLINASSPKLAKGRRLVGTFSSTDIRSCPTSQMLSWLHAGVLEYREKLPTSAGPEPASPKELVVCHPDSTLGQVINQGVTRHVHRIWVVDRLGMVDGIVSLTDMIRATRVAMLSEP